MTTLPRIAFVGVGRMGANMARRLKEKGYPIAALYDVSLPAARSLAGELGTNAVTSLAEVTAAAQVIITVVSDDAAMDSIYAPSGDSLLTGAKGKLFVNCATVSPAIHVEVERRLQAAGAHSLEASMASSITQAREGTLYMMCAGSQAAFDEARPVLEHLAVTVRYLGQAGNAAKVKALVNMVMNINTAGLAEGLGLGAALGLDLKTLTEVFSETGAASRVLQTDGDDMLHREHECYFSAAHAAKDSGIALELAREADLSLPLAEASKAQYDRMVAQGLGELDKSGIAELTFPGRGGSQSATS